MVPSPKTEKPRAILADGLGVLMKPLANGIEMKTITSNNGTQSGDGLTARQRQLLNYFDQIDDDTQIFMLKAAERYTVSFPRQRPQLKLVAGGAA